LELVAPSGRNRKNADNHISPTATEQELNGAISIITTMYAYATDSCITELETNGHDIAEDYEPMITAAETPVGDISQRG